MSLRTSHSMVMYADGWMHAEDSIVVKHTWNVATLKLARRSSPALPPSAFVSVTTSARARMLSMSSSCKAFCCCSALLSGSCKRSQVHKMKRQQASPGRLQQLLRISCGITKPLDTHMSLRSPQAPISLAAGSHSSVVLDLRLAVPLQVKSDSWSCELPLGGRVQLHCPYRPTGHCETTSRRQCPRCTMMDHLNSERACDVVKADIECLGAFG